MTETCPVCNKKHHGTEEYVDLGWRQLSSLGSNVLFGECVIITRGPDDAESFNATIYKHTYEQTDEWRNNDI